MNRVYSYDVIKLDEFMQIDGDCRKRQWRQSQAIEITNHMGAISSFFPSVHVKMMYDDENLYLIFHVKDRYVRCITKEYNGPVWEDACVEFFFAPDISQPGRYFNLEINCGGTALMHYNNPEKDIRVLDIEDIKKIEIAHTMPQIIDPEIEDLTTWVVEYRLPLEILEKYSPITNPEKGVNWRANFFKIAENNSNPHYLTWSFVDNIEPNFHLPQFFGSISFQ